MIGMLATTLVILENPSVRTAMLMTLTIWACCRACYFAFYVIEHYIDPTYQYAGLWAFADAQLLGHRPSTASGTAIEPAQKRSTIRSGG